MACSGCMGVGQIHKFHLRVRQQFIQLAEYFYLLPQIDVVRLFDIPRNAGKNAIDRQAHGIANGNDLCGWVLQVRPQMSYAHETKADDRNVDFGFRGFGRFVFHDLESDQIAWGTRWII